MKFDQHMDRTLQRQQYRTLRQADAETRKQVQQGMARWDGAVWPALLLLVVIAGALAALFLTN